MGIRRALQKTRALLSPFSIESLAILPVTPNAPCRLRHVPSHRHGPTAFLLFSFGDCGRAYAFERPGGPLSQLCEDGNMFG